MWKQHADDDRGHDLRGEDFDEHHGGGKVKPQASNLVFFGDSLTDNGNLFKLTQGTLPDTPWWKGRFSNGPTYAEQLPGLLGVSASHVQNYAYGGARAVTGNEAPIDLDIQVQAFVASLRGHAAPKGTEAVLYIGNNDYLNYTPSETNPPEVQIGAVISKIQTAILTLQANGVEKFVVFTLPHFSITPAGQYALTHGGAELVAAADAIIDANNAALQQLVAGDNAIPGLHVKLVDANVFGDAVAADGHAFGFKDLSLPIFQGEHNLPTLALSLFAPNEIAFTNDIHPTYAAHGAQAAFAAATLNADNVELYRAGSATSMGTGGADFIFAVKGNNTFYSGTGDDIIYTGNGTSTAWGGAGNDFIFAGGTGNKLYGEAGNDLLAVNASTGLNVLDGGRGNDILIANREGDNIMRGGSGDNLFVLKEDASAGFKLIAGAGAGLGQQSIFGGQGDSVLRFIINDHDLMANKALVEEFNVVANAYTDSLKTNHAGTFTVNGLDIHNIDGVQLQIDGVSSDPATPYLITHTIAQTFGHGPELDPIGQALLSQAGLWGLLTA
jgi:phospholipase/lecithinase/hemolysin